MQSKYYIC